MLQVNLKNCKENNLSSPYEKYNTKWIMQLNVKCKPIKDLGKKQNKIIRCRSRQQVTKCQIKIIIYKIRWISLKDKILIEKEI